ncbi:MAG: SGNH/GDSL hydrolase family protein [Deltaproteobacteria bacterium]|nr:SGNH/GDSL hydrolase family protein [Deltaproteobacteria bacterium]
MRRTFFNLILSAFLLAPAAAFSCPLIDGLVDSNCDGVLKIGFAGDSFVKGVGDRSELGGGYVSRIAELYPNAVIVKYPQPGIASGILLSRLIRKVPRMASGPADRDLHDTDVLIIDVGRNDYWEDRNPPNTVGNIRRIVKFLTAALANNGQTPPVIAVTMLAPTNRAFQAPFISAVDSLLVKQRSASLPAYVRADLLRNSLISRDGLHPNALGYADLAQIIKTYLETKGLSRARAICRDNDNDGIFDKFEASKFGTNPALADTDSDGYNDGDEVFTHDTDPTDPNSHP